MQDYPYFYETHLHTALGSKCGKNTPEEMVYALKTAGYTGTVITEHNWGGNTAIDRELDFDRWVEGSAESYLRAKALGDRIGVDVFWGYEAGFRGTEFLIYGLTPEWLKAHPEIRQADLEQHLTMVRQAGATVIHAHPFRERSYIAQIRLFPELVDGVEAFNYYNFTAEEKAAGAQVALSDSKALVYARAHGLPITAGSDLHRAEPVGAGMAFRRRMADIHDLCRAILNREDCRLTNGKVWFDQNGQKVGD